MSTHAQSAWIPVQQFILGFVWILRPIVVLIGVGIGVLAWLSSLGESLREGIVVIFVIIASVTFAFYWGLDSLKDYLEKKWHL